MFKKTKKLVNDHKTAVIVGVSFTGGIAATLFCLKPAVSSPPAKLFAELSLDLANPAEFPLVLSEEEIKRRLAAGILFDMYIRKQGLCEGFDNYAETVIEELVGTN